MIKTVNISIYFSCTNIIYYDRNRMLSALYILYAICRQRLNMWILDLCELFKILNATEVKYIVFSCPRDTT